MNSVYDFRLARWWIKIHTESEWRIKLTAAQKAVGAGKSSFNENCVDVFSVYKYMEIFSPSDIHAHFAIVYRHVGFIHCFQSFFQCSCHFDISMRICIFNECAIALNQLQRIHSPSNDTTQSHTLRGNTIQIHATQKHVWLFVF